METTHDVVICGGGLAGLTLARQLEREQPALRVTIVEPSRRPLPEATHKVGESTVEVGTRYLAQTLGLKEYLDAEHLPKNGLRFFSGDNLGEFKDRVEFGPFEFPPVPSYQLDRGKLENDLRAMVEGHVDLREGFKVTEVEIGEPHRVTIEGDDGTEELTARWVIDATGRRHLLRRKLDLAAPSRIDASSSWFRVPEKVDVAELVPQSETRWHTRDNHDNRWLSTNHLTGPGYWVWIIPLQNDHTSIGIVAETEHHPFDTIHTLERSLEWIAKHEPALAKRLEGVEVSDFLVRKQYSYSGKRFLSTDRWAAVGEAAFFTDPLYSQGTDYITFANTYTAEAIKQDMASLDGDGALDPALVELANQFMLRLFEANEDILARSGHVFRHADVFGTKLLWDYYYYWAFMAAWYFQDVHLMDVERQRRFLAMGDEYARVSRYIQDTARAWAELRQHDGWKPRTHVGLPDTLSIITELHMQLDVKTDPAGAEERMRQDLEGAKEFAAEVLYRALIGVGPDNAAELARRVDLGSWDLPLDAPRIGLQEGSRRDRRDGFSRVARDLERLMGHPPSNGTPLTELVEQALGRRVEEQAPAQARA